MSKAATRRSLLTFPLLLAWLAVGGAPASAVAQQAESAFDVVHAFDSLPRCPCGALIKGSDGALYGTTSAGGDGAAGVVGGKRTGVRRGHEAGGYRPRILPKSLRRVRTRH